MITSGPKLDQDLTTCTTHGEEYLPYGTSGKFYVFFIE